MKNYLQTMIKYISIFVLIVVGCSSPKADQSGSALAIPVEFQKVLQKHGGVDRWNSFQAVEFDLGDEHHQISLGDRKTRIDKKEGGTMAFDGENVWVTDSADLQGARFYHNLFFYFGAMPFVLADPGISYDMAAPRQFLGNTYDGIRVSFAEGVGESSRDSYLLFYRPDHYQMEWLMYESTFHSGQANNAYNLIHYSDWVLVNGLLMPSKIQWHSFDGDSVGGVTSEAFFEEIQLRETALADSLFILPENGLTAP